MGQALKYLREFFEKLGLELDRKSAASLVVLFSILILLPIGLLLIKNNLVFLPKAAGELIQLGEGGCIKTNKDKKKVVDCGLVPLKLINPFFNVKSSSNPSTSTNASVNSIAPSTSSSPSIAPSPSPSASPGVPKNINVKSFNNDIQAALDDIKTSGGSVYLPAGTYVINDKIRLYSNTTLFGDGMDVTIIKFADNIPLTDMMANDSSRGQSNITIRDMSLSGPGLLNFNSGNCCNGVPYGLKLENLNSAFVINVSVDNFPSHGIYIGYKIKEGKPQGVKNARLTGCRSTNNGGVGVYLVDTDNVVVDHCNVQGNGLIQPIDGITLGPDNGSIVVNSKILDNNVTGNKGNGIGLASCQEEHAAAPVNNIAVCNNVADPNDYAGLRQHKCNAGVFGNVFIGNSDGGEFDNTGGGEILNGPASACSIPANLATLPAVPTKPTVLKIDQISPLRNLVQHLSSGNLMNLVRRVNSWINVRPVLAATGFSGTQTNGCGEIISSPSLGAAEGDLVYRAPVKANNQWQTNLSNGTVVTQQQIIDKGVADSRVGNSNFLAPGFINCDIFIDYSDSGSCTIDSPPKGREGVNGGRLLPGESVTLHVKSANNPAATPGCRIQMQTAVADNDSNDVFAALDSLTTGTSPSPSSAKANGSVLRYRLAETQAGLNQAPWKEFALKSSENKLALREERTFYGILSSFSNWLVSPASAQDNDDVFVNGGDSDSDDQFVSSQSASSLPTSSGNPSSSVGPQFINTTFQLKDVKPGTKQIWVQYMHPDGSTRVDNVTFDLVDKTPQILGLACNLDITKENLKITIDGNYFGNAIGNASVVTPTANLEVLGWNNTQVSALLKKPSIPINEGQRFKIKVTRPDGFESGTAVCAVDKSLVSLGARIFCREPGKFNASDVSVTLLSNNPEGGKDAKPSKVEEKVTINAGGEIENLKTQLQVGKNYAIAIKAPNSLRRTALFTALEGTTEIVRPDGAPFILPVGDIAPIISLDGQINALDRAELIRQWRTLGQGETKQTGDFNRDSKVNSIDWACMQYDFGSSDDPLPTEVPGSTSSTLRIPDSASDTLFIPVSSPKPTSSPTSLLLHPAEFLLIS